MDVVAIGARLVAAAMASAVCLWLIRATLPRRSSLVGTLVAVAVVGLAAAVLPPPAGLALALALAAPLAARAIRGMLGALAASTLALIAGILDAPLGLAALGAAFWVGGQSAAERAMLGVVGVALALMPLAPLTFGLRLTFLVACLVLAILFRRASRQVALGPAALRLSARLAAAMPALAVLALFMASGRYLLGPTAVAPALALAAAAVVGGILGATGVLGSALLFATANEARSSWAGASCAALLGTALLGASAAAFALIPLALGLSLGAALAPDLRSWARPPRSEGPHSLKHPLWPFPPKRG